MQILIMSRSQAKHYTYSKRYNKNFAVISITDIASKNNTLNFANPFLKAVLQLKFDDVEHDYIKDGILWYQSMRHNDGLAIVNFINIWKDKIDLLIVHCEAGISRSSGVAAAISRNINGNDFWVFENGKYVPNMHCYKIVNECFENPVTEEDLTERKRINLDRWTKIFDEME